MGPWSLSWLTGVVGRCALCVQSAAEKVSAALARMEEEMAQHLVVSALDEVAWLLNFRGCDVDFIPVGLCAALVSSGKGATTMRSHEREWERASSRQAHGLDQEVLAKPCV